MFQGLPEIEYQDQTFRRPDCDYPRRLHKSIPLIAKEDTAIAVGTPNLRLPISLNACPSIFLNFVHRTTSHGTCGLSLGVISVTSAILLEYDDILECREPGEGDPDDIPKDE